MVPMHLGPRLSPRALAVLAGIVGLCPALVCCGLFGGTTLDEAMEYLPQDTLEVRFADRAAMAERLDVDDIDPRDVSEDDLERFASAVQDADDAVAHTLLDQWAFIMKDAPLNPFDVIWEAQAWWGEPGGKAGGATVWKVGDDLDFDVLADDLTGFGYEERSVGDLSLYSIDEDARRNDGTIGGVYPAPAMLNVLLDEDEQVVAASLEAEPLEVVADVIADDTDSLADEGAMDDLISAADDDPEVARIVIDPTATCFRSPLPEEHQEQYADLGHPQARALFVSDSEPAAVLILQYDDEGAAEDDLDARQQFVDDGMDPRSARPFEELGSFELEQDGDLLTIEQDLEEGAAQAVAFEDDRGGPGFCLPED